MPPKRKAPAVKKDSAESQVLEYLEKQYRPYSANDIFQNLHGAVGKPAVTKAIESLTEQGKIQTKLFGKMTVSVARQIEVKVNNQNEDSKINTLLITLKKSLETTQNEINRLQKEFGEITQNPDDETVEKEFQALKATVDKMEKQVESNKTKKLMSPDTIIKIKSISVEIEGEYEKRKKLYKSFKGFLSEHIDPKKLIDQLGLDEPEGKL